MKRFKLKFKTTPIGPGKLVVIFVMVVCTSTVTSFNVERLVNSLSDNEDVGKFSSKALWVHKGKFVFPAGTTIIITPQIAIPAFRRRPFNKGLQSDIQLSMPLYLTLDKMGFTTNMHPFPFDVPPFWPFGSMRRPIDSDSYSNMTDTNVSTTAEPEPMIMMNRPTPVSLESPPSNTGEENFKKIINSRNHTKVFTYFPFRKRPGHKVKSLSGEHIRNRRNRRSIMALPPPESLHGSDRALLFPKIEEMLANVGFEGRGCMLRVICEVHEFPLQEGYGLFGDLIGWFFSVSQSPYAESHMPKYLKAEEAGRNGDCNEYKKVCAKSLFKWELEKKSDHNEL